MKTLDLLDTLATDESFALTREEQYFFHDQGYLGPFALCTPEEMDAVRAYLDEDLFRDGFKTGGISGTGVQSRHLDDAVVYALCSHPAIIDRMASILGPDIAIWRSNFFKKDPGGKRIPWHQDLNYWPIEPPVNLSAWLAIDNVTVENSCVQILPGSHKAMIPHIKSEGTQFQEEADQSHYPIKPEEVKNMELKPGEFFLFTERLLHHSEPNRSDLRRLGLAVRVTVPWVRVYHEQLFDGHANILVRGRDHLGINRLADPPRA